MPLDWLSKEVFARPSVKRRSHGIPHPALKENCTCCAIAPYPETAGHERHGLWWRDWSCKHYVLVRMCRGLNETRCCESAGFTGQSKYWLIRTYITDKITILSSSLARSLPQGITALAQFLCKYAYKASEKLRSIQWCSTRTQQTEYTLQWENKC